MARADMRIVCIGLACLSLLLLIYLSVVNQSHIQRIYNLAWQPGQSSSPQPLLIPVDTALEQPRVFRWTGSAWVQQVNFCPSSEGFKRIMLKTGAGETPMFIHDVSEDIYVSKTLARTGRWDSNLIDPFMSAVMKEPNRGVLDVGSQLGTYTLTAAKMGRHALAVDPLLVNLKRLCRSVTEGGLADKVTIVFAAISDSRGMANFDFQKGNVGRTVIVESSARKNSTDPNVIETVLLDDVLPLVEMTGMKSAVMKVDVEGHEFQAVAGSKKLLTKFPVPFIQMEWDWHTRGPKRGEDMTAFFKEKKYVPHGEDLIDFFSEMKYAPHTTHGEPIIGVISGNGPQILSGKRNKVTA